MMLGRRRARCYVWEGAGDKPIETRAWSPASAVAPVAGRASPEKLDQLRQHQHHLRDQELDADEEQEALLNSPRPEMGSVLASGNLAQRESDPVFLDTDLS
jgi:hypothetical protein